MPRAGWKRDNELRVLTVRPQSFKAHTAEGHIVRRQVCRKGACAIRGCHGRRVCPAHGGTGVKVWRQSLLGSTRAIPSSRRRRLRDSGRKLAVGKTVGDTMRMSHT